MKITLTKDQAVNMILNDKDNDVKETKVAEAIVDLLIDYEEFYGEQEFDLAYIRDVYHHGRTPEEIADKAGYDLEEIEDCIYEYDGFYIFEDIA